LPLLLQLPNETELLAAVVQKVGPFADRDKLCYHIRISAGKVHWAGEQLPCCTAGLLYF
jgi:hypothetical protein